MRDPELNGWWRAGSAITAVLMQALFRVRLDGLDHLPSSGPAILAFNHVSVLDGPCLAIATARGRRRSVRFLVAAEIFRRFFVGWVLRRFQQIPIRRGEGDVHALDVAIETVRGGALAAIAPEGRVNVEGAVRMQRIRSGVARIAIPAQAPVIPVGIWGTQVRWPKSGLRVRGPLRPTLVFAYGEPLDPPAGEAQQDGFLRLVGDAIEERVTQARSIAAGAR
jgi:1-acyl-sn-glycerol-3-phosphate acyltransferase